MLQTCVCCRGVERTIYNQNTAKCLQYIKGMADTDDSCIESDRFLWKSKAQCVLIHMP